MLTALAADFRGGLFGLPRLRVWTRMCEGIEVVGHDHDAAAHGDLLLELAVGIAGAVPALVVRDRDLFGQLEDRPGGARENLRSDQGVALHQLELGSGETAGL